MTVDAVQFEVERFERSTAVNGTVRLQIAGRWRARESTPLTTPILLLDDGRRTRRFAPSPGGADAVAGPDPPPWRADYSAPAALLAEDRVAFSLETSLGVVTLPRPRPRPRRGEGESLRRRLEAEREAREAAEQQAGEVAAQVEALANELEAARSQRSAVERERDGVLAEVERLTALLGRQSAAQEEAPDAGMVRRELELVAALGGALQADLEDALEDLRRATDQIAADERERIELEQRLAAAIVAAEEAAERADAEAAARATLETRMAKLAKPGDEGARQAELARRAAARAAARAARAARLQAAEQAEARAEQRAVEQRSRERLRAVAAQEASERSVRRRAQDDQRRAAADSLRRRQREALREAATTGGPPRAAAGRLDDDAEMSLPARPAPVPIGTVSARSRRRAGRAGRPSSRLPSQVVVGVLLALIAGVAVILFILGLLHVTVTG